MRETQKKMKSVNVSKQTKLIIGFIGMVLFLYNGRNSSVYKKVISDDISDLREVFSAQNAG